jgi:hypothetical protein
MKKIIFGLFVVLMLAAIPVTVYLVRQNQEQRTKAAPATTLAFAPATATKKVNDEFSLEVRINTAENQIVAAELHITFDPAVLEAVSITNGALFPNILASGSIERGAASITVGAASATTPVTGTGTAAVLKLKAIAASTSPISVRFAPTTFVGALGENATNVLVGSTPATITVSADGQASVLTPTPTGAATQSAQLTPTPTQSATQSAQATTSGLLITSPQEDDSLASDMPTIAGRATPGATVTLTIYSEPITVTLTADANGNWSYTPTTPLVEGPHNVVASAQDPTSGETVTATTNFVVAAGGEGGGSTDSGIPVAGTVETTILLVSLGLLLIGMGAALPMFSR